MYNLLNRNIGHLDACEPSNVWLELVHPFSNEILIYCKKKERKKNRWNNAELVFTVFSQYYISPEF